MTMTAYRRHARPLFLLKRSWAGVAVGDFAACFRAVWGLMPPGEWHAVTKWGPPAVWLVRRIAPNPGEGRAGT
jgi:hypothetical protein